MRAISAFLVCLLATTTLAAAKDTSLAEAAEHALQQSSLTMPGSQPFHIKVSIRETSDPNSDDYKATIEEHWMGPSKWRRVITSDSFSQVLITNGDAVSETDTGDYYPHWLSNFVTAVIDGLPDGMLDMLKRSNLQVANLRGFNPSIVGSTECTSLNARVDRWVICFDISRRIFQSVFTKGYFAEYKDYKKFGNKWVARSVLDYPESGTTVEARITDLEELTQPDEQMFQIKQSTPADQRIRSVRIDEDTMRNLVVGGVDIDWPSVGEGLLKGGCGLYISADRSGQVREAIPEGCDNAALEEPMHDAAMKWHLKPAAVGGVRVQVEALLGLPFQTTLDPAKSLPNLSDSEARKLATNLVEPAFTSADGPKGTDFTVRISVDETGKFTGVQDMFSVPSHAFNTIEEALGKWRFKPYIKDGKPQYFHADLVFHIR